MSDDSDLLIAAAATAAVFTWLGTRRRGRGRRVDAAPGPDWRVPLQAFAAGLARCWRETPGYRFVQGIKEAFFRKH